MPGGWRRNHLGTAFAAARSKVICPFFRSPSTTSESPGYVLRALEGFLGLYGELVKTRCHVRNS